MNLQDLKEKAKQAKTPQELLALAKEANIEMSSQQTEKVFASLRKEGELADEELDKVVGGNSDFPVHCSKCGGSNFGLALQEIGENVVRPYIVCVDCGTPLTL